MPTENVNKADNLIDVGEADQESTEINLDNKGEPEKVEAPKEEKIEVEEVTDVVKILFFFLCLIQLFFMSLFLGAR